MKDKEKEKFQKNKTEKLQNNSNFAIECVFLHTMHHNAFYFTFN